MVLLSSTFHPNASVHCILLINSEWILGIYKPNVSLCEFFLPVVFHWRLSDSNSLQVSRTYLSIRADLNSAIVWMVLILSSVLPVSFQGLWRSFQEHKQWLVLPSTSYSSLFFLANKIQIHILFHFLLLSLIIILLCVNFYKSTCWWFSIDSKWLQVSQILQDSSQYSSQSQLCWKTVISLEKDIK